MADTTFWERLAAKVEPPGALATLEDPMTIVRISTVAPLGAAVLGAFGTALLLAFDQPTLAWALAALSLTEAASWVFLATSGNMIGVQWIIVVAAAATMIYLHIAMGGYANSGGQLFWAIAITVPAALVLRKNQTVAIALFFAMIAIVFGFWEQSLQATRPATDPALMSILFPIVLVGSLGLLVPMFIFVLARLSFERERAEGLLLNVLPAEVATELKERGKTVARQFDSISVLFADIVGFTPLSAEMAPEDMVDQLNDVFTYFDTLAERYGCEKIRTIGGNYMVASGVPTAREDHAEALCHMALGMVEYSKSGPMSFRVGINSGPAVAGVIGTRKFQYDIWGDTVNTASRMESHGEPGRIQISDTTHALIRDAFATTPRGPIEVKGKGTLTTHWLIGELDKAAINPA